jgi:hypothetical protein
MMTAPTTGRFQTHPPYTGKIQCAFERHDGLRCYAFFAARCYYGEYQGLPEGWSWKSQKFYCPIHEEEL